MKKRIFTRLSLLAFILAIYCEVNAVRPLVFDYTDLHKYPDNMSFTCVVEENGQRILDCEVAAFDENGELRGSYYSNDQGIVFLMVQGERDLGVLHFKVVTGDGDDKSEFTIRDINETYSFHYNDILGNPLNPFVFTVGNDNRKPLVALGTLPATVPSGYDAMDKSLTVCMDNDVDVTGLEFDIILPEGMDIIQQGMELSSERFNGTSGRFGFVADKNSSYQQKPDGSYHVTIENTSEIIKGSRGRLIDFYYKTQPMDDGVYPVYVKNVLANYVANGMEKVERVDGFTSYVVVGTPTAQQLHVTSVLPAFVTEALSTDNTVTTLDLTEARYILGYLTLDGKNLLLPPLEDDAVKTEHLSYTHKATDSSPWATLCLPFAVDGTDDVKLYEISSVTPSALNLTLVESVEAYTPVIFNSPDDVTFTSDDCSLYGQPSTMDAVDGLTLTGVFAETQITSGYYIDGDTFRSAEDLGEGAVKVEPFSAYLAGTASGAEILKIVAGQTTGMGHAETCRSHDANVLYDIAGHRVSNLRKGMYIINGKVLVKK